MSGPSATRRFPPASTLQTTGELKAVQMLAFVTAATEMVAATGERALCPV